jgi:hypothetical protein
MAPRVFYRVEDADSSARYVEGKGILAADTETVVHFANKGDTLLRQVKQHLHWGNRRPTPFISTYCYKSAAWREAKRRAERGKEDVAVYKIDMNRARERAEYRDIRRLASELGLYIEPNAWNNSEHEWIFLHCVPEEAVVELWK